MGRGPASRGRPTLADVAEAAGVSAATASRALSDAESPVGEETRQRVRAAADAVGYRTRAPRERRIGAIGVLTAELTDPMSAAIAAGVVEAASLDHRFVTVDFWPEGSEIDARTALRALEARPHALILVGTYVDDDRASASLIEELSVLDATTRLVVVGSAGLPFDTIAFDERAAFASLADELVATGRRRIGMVMGPRRLRSTRERMDGALDALRRHGVEVAPSAIIHAPLSRDGGYSAVGELLSRQLDLDALLTADDLMGIGAVARLREAGIAMPDDVAIVCFGDSDRLRDVTPPLTSVRYPFERIGADALAMSLERRARAPRAVTHVGELVARASTRGESSAALVD